MSMVWLLKKHIVLHPFMDSSLETVLCRLLHQPTPSSLLHKDMTLHQYSARSLQLQKCKKFNTEDNGLFYEERTNVSAKQEYREGKTLLSWSLPASLCQKRVTKPDEENRKWEINSSLYKEGNARQENHTGIPRSNLSRDWHQSPSGTTHFYIWYPFSPHISVQGYTSSASTPFIRQSISNSHSH